MFLYLIIFDALLNNSSLGMITLLVSVLIFTPVWGIYEDQIGKFDWYVVIIFLKYAVVKFPSEVHLSL